MTGFTVANGKIIDPNGNSFIARGVCVLDSTMSDAIANLLTFFPGVNMVRVAAESGYQAPTYYTPFVNAMTAKGIVVQIGNYNALTTSLSGKALTTETNWYAALATAFKANPLVWFSTLNEPQAVKGASVSGEQLAIYNAIRATGNTNPVGIEPIGGWTTGGFVAADYVKITNVHFDVHFYNWVSNYATDVPTNAAALTTEINNLGNIKSADGVMPVLIGEYGNSTDGNAIDVGWQAVVQAVNQSGYGSAAWIYQYPGGNAAGDQLFVNGETGTTSGGLSAYGKLVASYINASVAPPGPTAAQIASLQANVADMMAQLAAINAFLATL